jgi:Fe2+ transport system protein FeoA
LDLGLLPGTLITVEYESPQRDPTAYRVRDSLIALRDDQASSIIVEALEAV